MITPVLPTYARIDLEFERGEGCWLVTTDGRRYLDFTAGIAVNVLGHAHPHLVEALREQAGKLWHTSNLFRIAGGERLANRLTEATFADTMFFTNSGAEALECAIKMARRYQFVSGSPERNRLITFEGAFHGRTLATIAAGGNAKYLEGFSPDMPGFDQVPFGDIEAVKAAIGPHTAGILLEPIQGEGGVRVPPASFLRQLRDLCDEHGLLLVLDEVQSGVGRTGRLFAHEASGITPDIMAVAKGIGGGFPMGACLATEEAAKGMTLGTHGSTYGGNPLAMAVGNAVLDMVLADGFLDHVRNVGGRLKQRLAEVMDRHPRVIAEVRGEGLLLGLRAHGPAADLVLALREEGMLAPGAGDNVVRLLPPLVVSEEEVGIACDKIEAACQRIEDGLNMAAVKGAAE
ncbi:aspartate aminotransferase family protein [Aquabacter sp. L1I39]|uniref:aspartate aminotransferase family protein n=1 Tax=Aquabacter sp. L1I39 TaxID=2820278 RepID=UPI001ADBEA36|nr:aspartate aminotransferase family protein [Aquabacter sp. L1I39]QTL04883.1 aspartate aminotransferase family protein [Aquabacter sp. L1I39]